MNRNRFLFLLLIAAVSCGCALAQDIGATLQGTVTDPSDAVVPNVTVDLKNVATGAVRNTQPTSEGIFRFNSVQPAVYDLIIKAAGFKEYTQKGITLNVSEIRDLGRLKLTVGAVSEEVQVTAQATPVQTASSENASIVDFEQMARITVRGRDLFSLLQTLPGVNTGTAYLTATGSGQSNYETATTFALGAVNINGMSSNENYTVDGVTSMDSAGDGQYQFAPNVDAVAEVRVLSSNYQAEYGRNPGGQIQVVTKGGTQQFHGSVNYNKRHEMFNANFFFNNYTGAAKPHYRFLDLAYSVGGPVYIPKLFNTQKKKVFFLLSQDYLWQRSNPSSGYANVPNPNQRKGDLSYDPNSTGTFVANSLRNPMGGANSGLFTPWSGSSTGVTCQQNASCAQQLFSQFAPNFDASSQAWGQAMMAALPLPNLCNAAAGTSDGNPWNGILAGVQGSNLISPTNCPSSITSQVTGLATGNIDAQGGPGTTNNNTRNYFWIYNGDISQRNDVARVDLNLTSKLTSYVRYGFNHYIDETTGAIPLKNVATGKFEPTHTPHPAPGRSWAIGLTYTITPTTVNQLILGYSWNQYAYWLDAGQLDRANMAAKIGGQLVNPPSFHNFAKDPLFNLPATSRPEAPDGQMFYGDGFPTVNFGGGNWTEAGLGQPTCNGPCPNFNSNPQYSVSDSLSKTVGSHNFKAGIYWEHVLKVETSTFNNNLQGTYSFSGASDPFFGANTMDGLANAFLGNMKTYSEGQRVVNDKVNITLEAFFQDSWRVARRLTLDLGVRFSHMPANQDVAGLASMFVPSTYNPAAAERIFYPYCTVSTATAQCPANTLTNTYQYSWDQAQNPNAVIGTGKGGPGNMYPSYLAAGTLVPTAFNGVAAGGYSGATNPYTGMQQVTWDNPILPLQHGVYQPPAFAPAFRFGFAWDAFGNGKTAVRGGFGQNLRREPNTPTVGTMGAAPVTMTLTQYYGTIGSIATNPLAGYTQNALPAANGVVGLSPYGTTVLIGPQKYESAYNGSFEVQQDVGHSTVVQAGYVFVLQRHLLGGIGVNNVTSLGVPQGTAAFWNQLQPAALNPLNAYLNQYLPGNASGQAYNDNYFRTRFPGYGAVTMNGFQGSTDIHSLQASLRRNFTKRMSYSVSYTWLKTMSLSGGRSSLFTDKYRNWGPSYSPTPMYATFTYVYQLPEPGKRLNFKPLGWVTDNWEWSGTTQIRGNIHTGVPTISFANTNSTNLVAPTTTGTSVEGARMNIVGDWRLPASQVSFVGGPTSGAAANIGVNGTPGNAIINDGAFMAPNPCSLTPNANPRIGVGQNMSCFGNAGAGSLITIPGTHLNNWDMTFRKKFPLKSEKRTIEFRAEIYNIFNHTQFLGAATGQSYDWNNWKTNGLLVPTNGSTGRYTSSVNPRLMSMALRFQF